MTCLRVSHSFRAKNTKFDLDRSLFSCRVVFRSPNEDGFTSTFQEKLFKDLPTAHALTGDICSAFMKGLLKAI